MKSSNLYKTSHQKEMERRGACNEANRRSLRGAGVRAHFGFCLIQSVLESESGIIGISFLAALAHCSAPLNFH